MSALKEQPKHIGQLHNDHTSWLSEIRLHADELRIFQQRLEEIATKNNATEVQKSITHFQNQLIIQKEQLDILSHNIRKQEQLLAQYAQEHPVAIDHVLFKDHKDLREQNETFNRLFRELKTEFNAFLGRWE